MHGERGPGKLSKLMLFPLCLLADLNLIDWSSGNVLAVALDNSVYLWSASSGDILQLLQMEQPGDYVSSVAWIKEGNYLAVGTSSAEVQVRLGARAGCLGAWDAPGSVSNPHGLSSSGMCSSRSGSAT